MARLRQSQGKVKVKLRQCKWLREGQGKVKAKSMISQGKVKSTQAQPQPQLQFDGF